MESDAKVTRTVPELDVPLPQATTVPLRYRLAFEAGKNQVNGVTVPTTVTVPEVQLDTLALISLIQLQGAKYNPLGELYPPVFILVALPEKYDITVLQVVPQSFEPSNIKLLVPVVVT